MSVYQRIKTAFPIGFWCAIFACLALMVSSCKKDAATRFGDEFQPENEYVFAKFANVDSSAALRLIAYSIADAPGITSNTNVYFLGSYNDETFGTMTVDLISHVYEYNESDTVPKLEDYFQSEYLIDSVHLILGYAGAYPYSEGMPIDPMVISIGELNNPLLIDDSSELRKYYSNDDRSANGGFTSGSVLSHYTAMPNLRDSVIDWASDTTGQTKTHVASLKIPLNDAKGRAYAQKLLRAGANNLPKSTGTFAQEINGLYIEAHPETGAGRGNIMSFDFSNSETSILPGIRVYYKKHQDDTASTLKTFELGGFTGAMTYNHIDFDRSTASSDFTKQLDKSDTTLGQNMVFSQAFFSSMIQVEMPDIREFLSIIDTNQQLVINQACLIMCTSPNGQNGRFTPSSTLFIRHLLKADHGTDSLIPMMDYSSASDYVSYNSSKSEYRFYITRHVQNLLINPEDVAPNLPLTMLAPKLSSPNMTSIFGPNAAEPKKRMRLEIVYSVIPKSSAGN